MEFIGGIAFAALIYFIYKRITKDYGKGEGTPDRGRSVKEK